MKVLAFVGTPGGGDSASMAYNLAWMYADLGFKVLCVDLTTSTLLTGMFFAEDQLEDFWPLDAERGYGFFGALWPLVAGEGDPERVFVHTDHSLLSRDLRILAGADDDPAFEELRERLTVVVGDPAAARFTERLERAWRCERSDRQQALQVVLACRQVIRRRAEQDEAGLVVVDLGEHVSPLTRAGLLAADACVTVTSPTPASRRALGTFERLRLEWRDRWRHLAGPAGETTSLAEPIGAIDLNTRPDRLGPPRDCIARFQWLRSLGPLSRESGKPIFLLGPSDGAMGGYAAAVFDAKRELRDLAREIARRAGIELPAARS